jgi:RNA-directed DNA polymerase
MVYDAWKQVRENRGGAGIDGQSIKEFEKDLSNNLYKLWNRLTSGSYFPQSVKQVGIPKASGGTRYLGIPTVSDRIAQMVVKTSLEQRIDHLFNENSFGYRPKKSAHMALKNAVINCRTYDWVIDLDIKGFFDNIDHELLEKALVRHANKWEHMYIRRWLEASVQKVDGTTETKQGKGTPQGGVISPLLANLFLHYVFDEWMRINHSDTPFERYADDIIIHCKTIEEAQKQLNQIKERLLNCGLEVHPEKSKIVYCKDGRRKGDHKVVQFKFLGFDFQPRNLKSIKDGKLFLGYYLAISKDSKQRILSEIRKTNLHKWSDAALEDIAIMLNPKLQGWVNYYGKFSKYALMQVFVLLDKRLEKFLMNKYKLTSVLATIEMLKNMRKEKPKLFVHWRHTKVL